MYVQLIISFIISLTLSLLAQNNFGHAYKTTLNDSPITKHPEIFVGAAAYTRTGLPDQQVTKQPNRSPPKPIAKPSQPSQVHKLEPKTPINSASIIGSNSNNVAPVNPGLSDSKRDAAESATNTRFNDDTCLVRITINDDWLHYARFRLMNAIKRLVSIIGNTIQRRKQQHHRIHKRDTRCLWNSNPGASSWSLDVIAKKPTFQPIEKQQQSQQQFGENFPGQMNEFI